MNEKCKPNAKRACVKIVILLAIATGAAFVLAVFLNGQALDYLKHGLNLWTIVALVMMVNLLSFICFIVFAVAYHWVKQDLKGTTSSEEDDLLNE